MTALSRLRSPEAHYDVGRSALDGVLLVTRPPVGKRKNWIIPNYGSAIIIAEP